MSDENVEVVRRAYAALTQGDGDTLHHLVAPEFVADNSRRLVEPVVVRRGSCVAFELAGLRLLGDERGILHRRCRRRTLPNGRSS